MSDRSFRVAVLGATGAVGREMVAILEQRRFPVGELVLLATQKSEGERLSFRGDEVAVRVASAEAFEGVEVALFSAGAAAARHYAPLAAERGAVVVDNSSAFRADPEVPLVVPEVNPLALAGWKARRVIANPNCSTIQMVVVLKPIHDAVGIKRLVVCTYQAVSGAGHKGIEELEHQVRDLFNLRELRSEVFPQRIAFNCLPCIPQRDAFDASGHSTEELKMVNETRKILAADIRVSATCVRVPVFNGHGEAVHLELNAPLDPEAARELLRGTSGVAVIDDPSRMVFPTQVDVANEDMVMVGRVRADPSTENGLALWIVADNLRKGAALNAVQIAELLVAEHLD